MIGKLLSKLFAAGPGREPEPADPIEYAGYTIVATPRQVQGGWSTEGVITKTVEGEPRREHFIRADTLTSREEAIAFSRDKARKIIDEQGDRLFAS